MSIGVPLIKGIRETIGDRTCTTAVTYDDDGRVATYRKYNSRVTYTYESRGRLSTMVTNHTYGDGKDILTETYTYRNPADGKASAQVSQFHTQSIGDYDVTYEYTYDANGNILSAYDGTYRTRYEYDTAGQLLRENNYQAGKTWIYTYDDAGNITSKSTYAYTRDEDPGTPIDTVTYGYTSENWGDLLKEYNGSVLYYDNCANLVNGPGWRYSWEHGRQLAAMEAKDGSGTWNFTYNADGLRTSRSNGTVNYKYQYLNGQLVKMTIGDLEMYFNYDASGVPVSIVYNGSSYYYVTNLQGDVVGIVNQSGNQLVAYTYDAWGNILTTTGTSANSLGKYNPLRYRGYVYDTETKLYYLQSRYYNPEWGRFINADALVSTGQGLLGNNMFAYCGNNPVNMVDPNGYYHYVFGIDTADPLAFAQHNNDGGAISCGSRSISSSAGYTESYAVYDSQRKNPSSPICAQICALDYSVLSFSSKKVTVFSGELCLLSCDYVTPYVELSPFDLGVAEVSMSTDQTGMELSAMASAWSPSASLSFDFVTVSVEGHVGAIGAKCIIKTNQVKFGFASGCGGSISIEWGGSLK